MFGKILGMITGAKEGESLYISIEYLMKSNSEEEREAVIKKIIMMILFGFNRIETEDIRPLDIAKGYRAEKDKCMGNNDLVNASCCTIVMYYIMSLPYYAYEGQETYTKYIQDIDDFLIKGIFTEHLGYFSESNNELYNKLIDKQTDYVNNH